MVQYTIPDTIDTCKTVVESIRPEKFWQVKRQ
jgi:hypothetical protein